MKRLYSLLGLAMVIALLTGCSPYTLVNSETYNGANLAQYKTFRIVTPGDGHLPPGMQLVTYYNIAAAIREQMAERGYTESPTSPLLINFGVTVKREIATAPAFPNMYPPVPAWGYPYYYNGYYRHFIYPRPYYWPSYYNPNAQVITGIYREGVLTMDMVNIQEMLPLYSASVATVMQNGMGQYRNLQGIAEAVQTLFSKFPVKPLPQP